MKECKVCKVIPIVLGKKFLMPLLKHNYPKIELKEIEIHLIDLNLEIVGGLKNRGWTSNDIDVIGKKKDIYFQKD